MGTPIRFVASHRRSSSVRPLVIIFVTVSMAALAFAGGMIFSA